MISIDTAICNGCGMCADVCPDYVLHKISQTGMIDVRHPALCCECGHCAAICPQNAITGLSHPQKAIDKQPGDVISPDMMEHLLLSRRSIRQYKPEAIPETVMASLMTAAANAGTGGNTQTTEFMVIRDTTLIGQLEQQVIRSVWRSGLMLVKSHGRVEQLLRKKLGPVIAHQFASYHDIIKNRRTDKQLPGMIFRNAPVIIVAHDIQGNPMGHANCAIALRNMEIMALPHGLGTCWSGWLMSAAMKQRRKIHKLLQMPLDREIGGAIMAGYPRYTYARVPQRKERTIVYR
ncbi:MAG: nitroreductase family protein [Thermodesulfobacteriota bacterium]|nr:nitroreductase family protein [Thermodesulfobacteriota bacterium]